MNKATSGLILVRFAFTDLPVATADEKTAMNMPAKRALIREFANCDHFAYETLNVQFTSNVKAVHEPVSVLTAAFLANHIKNKKAWEKLPKPVLEEKEAN